jgi:hypothetical protein
MKSDFVQSKKRGRPATGINPSIGVRLPLPSLDALDDWRKRQPDLPSRPEAIRRLIEAGLRAADPIPIKNQKPGGGGAEKPPEPAVKPSRSSPSRTPKAAPVSKEAQLRALREQGAR